MLLRVTEALSRYCVVEMLKKCCVPSSVKYSENEAEIVRITWTAVHSEMVKCGGPLNLRIEEGFAHRRRIKTEEKAKVVTAVWGTELIQIYCRASYFAQGLFEQRDHFILFFISLWCISPYSLYKDHIFWRFIFQDERHHNGPISSKEQRSGMSNLGGG